MVNDDTNEVAYGADDSLLAEFFSWMDDAVTEMRALVDTMPEQVKRGADEVNRIYDLTHNIKGMGASFDFNLLTGVGLSLCGHLKGMDEDTLVSQRVLSSHVRTFEVILQHKIQGNGGDQGVALMHRLEAIIAEGK